MIKKADEHKLKVYFIKPPMGSHIADQNKDGLFPIALIPRVHDFYNALLDATVNEFSNAYLVDLRDIDFDNLVFIPMKKNIRS